MLQYQPISFIKSLKSIFIIIQIKKSLQNKFSSQNILTFFFFFLTSIKSITVSINSIFQVPSKQSLSVCSTHKVLLQTFLWLARRIRTKQLSTQKKHRPRTTHTKPYIYVNSRSNLPKSFNQFSVFLNPKKKKKNQ
jgi:hypothetical protein